MLTQFIDYNRKLPQMLQEKIPEDYDVNNYIVINFENPGMKLSEAMETEDILHQIYNDLTNFITSLLSGLFLLHNKNIIHNYININNIFISTDKNSNLSSSPYKYGNFSCAYKFNENLIKSDIVSYLYPSDYKIRPPECLFMILNKLDNVRTINPYPHKSDVLATYDVPVSTQIINTFKINLNADTIFTDLLKQKLINVLNTNLKKYHNNDQIQSLLDNYESLSESDKNELFNSYINKTQLKRPYIFTVDVYALGLVFYNLYKKFVENKYILDEKKNELINKYSQLINIMTELTMTKRCYIGEAYQFWIN